MAIWYLDYNSANTNANGSFAYPFSPASSVRGSMANGDELRILGNTLTNICNPTIYYANVINGSTINIGSGGNLISDFIQYSVIYFPTYDTFAKISSVASGNLYLYSGHAWPIPNTAVTNTTIQLVNTAIGVANQNTQSTMYILGGGTSTSNNIISDGWINATTRVTDGTVKSILNFTAPTGTPSLYFEIAGGTTNPTNNTFNLQNSILIGHINNPSPHHNFNVSGSNTNYNIHSIIGGINNLYQQGLAYLPIKNTYWNINNISMQQQPLFNATVYGSNLTFSLGNTFTDVTDVFPLSSTVLTYAVSDLTITVANVYANTIVSTISGFINYSAPVGINTTINCIGTFEYRTNVSSSIPLLNGIGTAAINLAPSFYIRSNGRNRVINTFSYIVNSTMPYGVQYQSNKIVIPTITLPAGYSYVSNGYTYSYNLISVGQGGYFPIWSHPKIPTVVTLEVPASSTFNPSQMYCAPFENLLLTYRDGSSPTEYLFPQGTGYASALAAQSAVPNVTLDSVTYRTTGPSLKSFLNLRTTGLWDDTARQGKARKTIKIPVTGGQSNTITGYIRTDTPNTLFANADVQMYTIFNGSILASNTITNQCCNAWSQFTMTFTPAYSGEATLVWEMYYSTPNKSYWLDDLTIS